MLNILFRHWCCLQFLLSYCLHTYVKYYCIQHERFLSISLAVVFEKKFWNYCYMNCSPRKRIICLIIHDEWSKNKTIHETLEFLKIKHLFLSEMCECEAIPHSCDMMIGQRCQWCIFQDFSKYLLLNHKLNTKYMQVLFLI